ncbi:glycosyltransferase family 4 protein [Roseiconus nitratireducens]|nr:glycosyltransferase family 1 protein [Roseiconus nitratireducens]
MKVLINALSVTNQSGRHVLMGHLNQLRELTQGLHQFVILHHRGNRDIVVKADEYEWLECPESTANWSGRAFWEFRNLNRIVDETESDFLFTPAGVSVPGIRAPQVVFCQNPWCLVPELHQNLKDRAKAALQRKEYRRTVRDATLMVFNSRYMREAYRKNAGNRESDSMVVYQAISDSTWRAAERMGKRAMERNHILSVSAMAPHKGADILVQALRCVRDRGVDAKLTFAGGWPDAEYRRRVESLVDQLGLREAVTFCGWISDEELHELYSRCHVFCLLSRCESFGIPAVEAQSFGTPTVGTDACAIPEIGGDGGLYGPVDDPQSAADHLVNVMTDDALWQQLSRRAAANSQKYRWDMCSRPLLKMFDVIERQRTDLLAGCAT